VSGVSKVKLSISAKLIVLITLLVLVIVSLSGVLGSMQTNRVIDDLGGKLKTKVNENLRAAGIAKLELLIQQARIEILQRDFATLQTIVTGVAAGDEDVTQIAVVDRTGTILAHTDKKLLGTKAQGTLKEDLKATNIQVHEDVMAGGRRSIAFAAPVEERGERLGTIQVAYTMTPLITELAQVKRLKRREVRSNVQTTLIFAVISGVIGLVLAVLVGFQISRPIQALVVQADKIAGGDLETRVQVTSRDEVGLLGERFNYMAEQVHVLMQQSVEKAAMDKEMEVARAIQATLIPDAAADIDLPGLDIASYFKPATQCGGDWWTYYCLPDGRSLLLIGDVTGHGVGSAMITAAAKGAAACLMAMTEGDVELEVMFRMLNAAILDTAKGQFAMSCFAGIYDPKKQTLQGVNAGHNFPYHYSAETKKMVSMVVRGHKLGDQEDSEFETRTFQLQQGDRLFWYTDGFIECVNEQGEEYGERRFRTLLRKNAEQHPETLRDLVVAQTHSFYGDVPPRDDITFLVARID
jgi:serine phosphatase RsbU (regulator of sigma subunit)